MPIRVALEDGIVLYLPDVICYVHAAQTIHPFSEIDPVYLLAENVDPA